MWPSSSPALSWASCTLSSLHLSLSAESFNIAQNSSILLHQSVFSWQVQGLSQPVTDTTCCRQQWGSLNSPQIWGQLVGKDYMPKATKGAVADEEVRAITSFPSSWCCSALWPWRNHLLFWCLGFLVGILIMYSMGQGGRQEGDDLNFPLVLGTLILGLCHCVWPEGEFGLSSRSQKVWEIWGTEG